MHACPNCTAAAIATTDCPHTPKWPESSAMSVKQKQKQKHKNIKTMQLRKVSSKKECKNGIFIKLPSQEDQKWCITLDSNEDKIDCMIAHLDSLNNGDPEREIVMYGLLMELVVENTNCTSKKEQSSCAKPCNWEPGRIWGGKCKSWRITRIMEQANTEISNLDDADKKQKLVEASNKAAEDVRNRTNEIKNLTQTQEPKVWVPRVGSMLSSLLSGILRFFKSFAWKIPAMLCLSLLIGVTGWAASYIASFIKSIISFYQMWTAISWSSGAVAVVSALCGGPVGWAAGASVFVGTYVLPWMFGLSDVRLKTKIGQLKSASAFPIYSYEWSAKARRQYNLPKGRHRGFIAQDLPTEYTTSNSDGYQVVLIPRVVQSLIKPCNN